MRISVRVTDIYIYTYISIATVVVVMLSYYIGDKPARVVSGGVEVVVVGPEGRLG